MHCESDSDRDVGLERQQLSNQFLLSRVHALEVNSIEARSNKKTEFF
jgi:hypothetical protein